MPDHVTAFGPGRVNLIGEHTDYNEGLALPFAISDGVTVRATALADRQIEAIAVDLGERDGFGLGEPDNAPGWRGFVRGAAGELQRAGVSLCGARLEISGTVPRGAGLSSSAALEVALALALIGLSEASAPDRLELAELCSRIENDWVGARTGLLDQIASLFGEDDRALRIDFRSLEVRPVRLELSGYKLVTVDSGERHANVASGYNERRAECGRACEELGIATLRDAKREMIESLPSPLAERARHVLTENERVEETVRALEQRDLEALGRLLNASHKSLRDDYEISTPAVEKAAQRLHDSGAIGARIIGGGFGGNVLGLLPPDVPVPDAATRVTPGPGARLLD
ncbi:MAG: galactokinase [Solirubrobacteraceae bacterium]